MCLSAWGLPTYALVRVFSGIFASVLGWGAYLDRQVASGLCGWRRLCFLSTPGDCWPSDYVFILPGSYHILTDALYRPLLLPRSAWSLALTVFLSFRELRPVQHYFFASSPYRCCPIYFSADTDANGQCQRAQTCFSILGAVSRLTRLLQWPSFLLFWPSSGRPLGRRSLSWLLFGPCALGSRTCSSIGWTILWLSGHDVSSFTFLALVIFPGYQSAPASRLAPLQRFTRTARLPSAIAERSSLACRTSSRAVCQGQWSISLPWCLSNGFYVSRPTYA